jgi:hypothetical protein
LCKEKKGHLKKHLKKRLISRKNEKNFINSFFKRFFKRSPMNVFIGLITDAHKDLTLLHIFSPCKKDSDANFYFILNRIKNRVTGNVFTPIRFRKPELLAP